MIVASRDAAGWLPPRSGRLNLTSGLAVRPVKVKTHDFPDKKLGQAVPYSVYDIQYNEAGVSVGIGSDTAEFAMASIPRWW